MTHITRVLRYEYESEQRALEDMKRWQVRGSLIGNGMEISTHTVGFDLIHHLDRAREWSRKTFGPGDRAHGVLDHIRSELDEIAEDPSDLEEWIDVVILALDGAWRQGYSSLEIAEALEAKQTKNENRDWPDWRQFGTDERIEHVHAPDKEV